MDRLAAATCPVVLTGSAALFELFVLCFRSVDGALKRLRGRGGFVSATLSPVDRSQAGQRRASLGCAGDES